MVIIVDSIHVCLFEITFVWSSLRESQEGVSSIIYNHMAYWIPTRLPDCWPPISSWFKKNESRSSNEEEEKTLISHHNTYPNELMAWTILLHTLTIITFPLSNSNVIGGQNITIYRVAIAIQNIILAKHWLRLRIFFF